MKRGALLILSALIVTTLSSLSSKSVANAQENSLVLPRAQAYWVYFDRRDTSDQAWQQTLNSLDSKARERRMRAMGQVLTESDLPLHPDDIAALEEAGARIRTISHWLGAASVEFPNESVRFSFAENNHVSKIQPVGTYYSINSQMNEVNDRIENNHTIQPQSPSLDELDEDSVYYGGAWRQNSMLGVNLVHDDGFTGAGVRVGFLDGGYNNWDGHNALTPIPVIDTWNAIDNSTNIETSSHGSKCLSACAANDPGNMVGVAPGIEVLLCVTEDVDDEYPEEEDFFVAGLEWVENNGADFVSTSLGYSDWYEFEDYDGNTCVTTIACDLAASRGMLVITSAGNNGEDGLSAPADGDSVLAIGAVDSLGDYIYFSSQGPTADGRIKPDVCAQGYLDFLVDTDTNDMYTRGNGTSYACPIVAGCVALMYEANPDLLPIDVINILHTTSTMAETPNNLFGWGIVDLPAAMEIVGVGERNNQNIPSEYSLGEPWPNPFNSSTNISFFVPEKGVVKAQVFDILGRQIAVLHNGSLTPGQHVLHWNSQSAAGTYFLQVSAQSGWQQTKRLVYVK